MTGSLCGKCRMKGMGWVRF